jgi:hypothetical protein
MNKSTSGTAILLIISLAQMQSYFRRQFLDFKSIDIPAVNIPGIHCNEFVEIHVN